ncbi:MAG: type II secretion system major pseudopilin GspG [Candidatus Omnitrophica bacterium]|nr:type II secretion system major pseudopilin GspG [Candidatus Omnitrophota bacterium]
MKETRHRRLRTLEASSMGFTLVELMLVIVIIGALAAMVVPRLAGRSEDARIAAAEADISGNISLALKLYEVDNGRYPTTEQGLAALIEKPSSPPIPKNWRGPYLEQEAIDSWGEEYVYRLSREHPPYDYVLLSLGPDAKLDTEDDIANWAIKKKSGGR